MLSRIAGSRSTSSHITSDQRTKTWLRHSVLILCGWFLLTPVGSVSADDQRISPSEPAHTSPSVAHLSNGNTVYVWTLTHNNFDEGQIIGRRYDTAGNALEAQPFVISNDEANELTTVEATSNGGFVVIWHLFHARDAQIEGIRGRIYGADGLPLGPEFIVNSQDDGFQVRPSLAVHSDNSFVTVWETTSFDGDGSGIAGRRFDALGNALGPDFVVNSETLGRQDTPEVAMDATGSFVVTWGTEALFGRLFDAAGTPLGDDFEIADDSLDFRFRNALARAADGRFMVAYESNNGPMNFMAGRILDASGNDLTGELMISTDLEFVKEAPALAVDAAGTFHVVWESEGQDGSGKGLYTQRIASDGSPIGGESRIHVATGASQRLPDVTLDAGGEPTYVWQSPVNNVRAIFTNCDSLGPCSVFSDGFESGDTLSWSTSAPP